MRRVFAAILGFLFFKWAYPGLDFAKYPLKKLFKCFIAQKVFGINREVPWPVHWTSEVKLHEKIMRGTETPGFAMNGYFDGRNGIILEENVWIGPKVSIISMNHALSDYNQYEIEEPIRIGRNSLLTTGCIILPGVQLGEHTVVAAGAVVTKSFPEENQLLAGIPAVMVKKLDPYLDDITKSF